MSHRNDLRRDRNFAIFDNQCRSLKNVLSTFGKHDYNELWEYLPDFCSILPGFKAERTRSVIISELYNVLINHSLKSTGFEELMVRLYVLYTALHSEKRTWTMLTFPDTNNKEDFRGELDLVIKSELNSLHIRCHIASYLKDECLWICLYFTPQNNGRASMLYLSYLPYLPYVCIAGKVSASIMRTVEKILMKIFHSPMEVSPLKSHLLETLHKMAYQNRHGRITTSEIFPRTHRKSQKRPALDEQIPEIENADLPWMRDRRKYVEKIFGKYEPPRMEKLSILTNTDFCGLSGYSGSDDKAKCAIIFQGSSVILGLSKFLEKGIIKRRLPEVMEDLLTSGTDTIYVND